MFGLRNEVASYSSQASLDESDRRASWATGVCKRCASSLQKVEDDDMLRGVATFSPENMMDLLWGFHTDEAVTKELEYCFNHATIVEEMLCSILHMQVDVCFLRSGWGKRYTIV